MSKSQPIRCLMVTLMAVLVVTLGHGPAQAAKVDSYVLRYLKAKEPVPLVLNPQGETQLFSPEELTWGNVYLRTTAKIVMWGGQRYLIPHDR